MQLQLLQHQQQHTASNLKSLHLLRALLREASYLPDATARRYFRRYIVNRFRAYQPAQNASSSLHAKAVEKHRHRFGKRRHVSLIQERTRLMQRKAKSGYNYLRMANSGDFQCLHKILYFAYGRIGKRKYTLLHRLLQPDDPIATQEPAPLQKLYYSNERCLSLFDSPIKTNNTHWTIHISDRYARLKAAVKAQHNNGVALGREIKKPYILTPINNVWERPMPLNRARSNVRRWYAETMTRFLPPLPEEEFDSIQAMANGTKRPSFVKRRSSPVTQLHSKKDTPESEKFTSLVQHALALEKPSRADKRADTRTPSVRLMKRLYTTLVTFCSKLVWNDKFNKWEPKWGNRLRGMNYQMNAQTLDLFAGVDAAGRVSTRHNSDRAAEKRATEERIFVAEVLQEYQKNRPKKEQYTSIPFYVDYLDRDHPIRIAADKVAIWEQKRRNQSATRPNTTPRAPTRRHDKTT